MNSFFQALLAGAARMGVRAGASALDSVLQDVEEMTEEATGRVKRTRAKTKRIVRAPEREEEQPRVIRINVKQRKVSP